MGDSHMLGVQLTRYVVNEHFKAFQGEGVHMGRPCLFVRLQGCDQQCWFCDSAGTWDGRWKSSHPKLASYEIRNLLLEKLDPNTTPDAFVVITGGEPTLYNLDPLVACLQDAGYKVHLETAGHHMISAAFDWVTVSPKMFANEPLVTSMNRADEFKIIVGEDTEYQAALEMAIKHRNNHDVPIWLHPEWTVRNDSSILDRIIELIDQYSPFANVRAGWQLHKLYNVDQKDPDADPRLIPINGVHPAK